jgi:hypothetical protein
MGGGEGKAPATWEDEVMESLKVVLDFVQALIWPAVVVWALLLFRRPLSERIAHIRRAKFLA